MVPFWLFLRMTTLSSNKTKLRMIILLALVALMSLRCQAAVEIKPNEGKMQWGPLKCDTNDFKHVRYDGEILDIQEHLETLNITEIDGKFQLFIQLTEGSPFQNYMGNWSCGANEWLVVGKPYVSHLGKSSDDTRLRASLAVMEEEKVTLLCKAFYFGSDKPDIVWDVIAVEGADKPNLTDRWETESEEPEGFEFSSKLKLTDENGIQMSDRANYTCEVKSANGISKRGILLRVKGKLAALWPFLGICAEVIILCTCIFIYERRTKARNASASEEEETPADGEVVVAGDDKAEEVRKRAPVKA